LKMVINISSSNLLAPAPQTFMYLYKALDSHTPN
jgi:hypothetical protein